jgi:hypothetical protein
MSSSLLQIDALTLNAPFADNPRLLVQFWVSHARRSGIVQFTTINGACIVNELSFTCDRLDGRESIIVKYEGLQGRLWWVPSGPGGSACGHCQKPLMPSYLCFGVYGLAQGMTGVPGWITIGQGEVYVVGENHVRNSFWYLERNGHVDLNVGVLKCAAMPGEFTGRPLIQLTPEKEEAGVTAAGEAKVRLEAQKMGLLTEFQRVHQAVIACHGGVVPRDLYYTDFNRVRCTDEWLYAQVYTMFVARGLDEQQFEKMDHSQKLSSIINGVTYIVLRMSYQMDEYKGGELSYEHFSQTVLLFECGDCEDLAWLSANLLCALQRRRPVGPTNTLGPRETFFLNACTAALQPYVVVNCVCQAMAPALKALKTQGLKIGQYISRENEKEAESRFHAYHMTCMLMRLDLFIGAMQRGGAIDKTVEPRAFLTVNEPVWDNLPARLYVESTAPIYPDPETRFSEAITATVSDIKNALLPGQEMCMLPSSENFRDDISCYGAVFEITTDFFLFHRHGNQAVRSKSLPSATIFSVEFERPGEAPIAFPLEEHFAANTQSFVFKCVTTLDEHVLLRANAVWLLEAPIPELTFDIKNSSFKSDLKTLKAHVSTDRTYDALVWSFLFCDRSEEKNCIRWPSLPTKSVAAIASWPYAAGALASRTIE